MQWSDRPVLLLGHGIRAAGAADLAPRLLDLGLPVVTSWQAKDLVDNFHPNYMGSSGIYGNRAANKVLYEANQVVAIGNRCAIWNVGYDFPREGQQLVMVDIDETEVRKFPQVEWINEDAGQFIRNLLHNVDQNGGEGFDGIPKENWAKTYLDQYPLVERTTHEDANGFINSYRFAAALQGYLAPNQIITTDVGGNQCAINQILRVAPPQRILSSGGLGEMGCGLPAAIGASFATNKGPVLCITGDGGLMLNLQSLQTVAHHKLPIKIIVFENDGYGMIKKTQDVSGLRRNATDKATGVSFPNFRWLAQCFDFAAMDIYTWDDLHRGLPALFASVGPALCVYHMNPEQQFLPKLEYKMVDGKPQWPTFDQMSPLL